MTRALEVAIDALYALPLAEFVAARQALAKTLKGEDARMVKALVKPTTIPWVVNLLKWRDAGAYDRVTTSGAAVRAAQIAALEGRGTPLRDATAAHRRTLAEAAQVGARLAASHGVTVDPDAVSRMLETVSLAERLAETPGRFTTLVQPAGFEALMGVALVASSSANTKTRSDADADDGNTRTPPTSAKQPLRFPSGAPKAAIIDPAAAAAAEKVEHERRAAREQRARVVAEAEARLAVAKQQEAEAREVWHRAKDVVDSALQAVDAARRST